MTDRPEEPPDPRGVWPQQPWPDPRQAWPPSQLGSREDPHTVVAPPAMPEHYPSARSDPAYADGSGGGRDTRPAPSPRRGRRARRRPTTTGSSALTACVAIALGVGAFVDVPVPGVGVLPALGIGVLVVQVALVCGWLRVAGVPGQGGGLTIGIAAALGVDALVLLGPADWSLRPIALEVAAVVLAAVVHQLARRGERGEVTRSMAACLVGGVLVALTATWLPGAIADSSVTAPMLAALAAAGVLEALASALRLPRSIRALVGVVAAAVAGGVVGLQLTPVTLATGAIVGGTAGVLGAAAFVVAALSRRYASDRTLFAATIPVAVVGPAAYFLGRLLSG